MANVTVNNANPTATVNGETINTVAVNGVQAVCVENEKVKVVSLGTQGPQGPQGVGGAEAPITSLLAGENLTARRIVTMEAGALIHASSDDLPNSDNVLGITQAAVSAGLIATIKPIGELNGFSGLTPDDPVYLGINGAVVQTLPVSGFILQVGVALTATTIFISIKQPIELI